MPTSPTIPSPRPSRLRSFLFLAAGATIAGVTLLVVSNLDSDAGSSVGSAAGSAGRRGSGQPIDAAAPTALDDAERDAASAGVSGRTLAQLEQGAWVQVTDETGRLAQQYSARRVEPLPDRWLELERPRAVLFQGDGRVVTMSAERGKARVPKQALETGSLDGSVEIRVFRPIDGRPADPERDAPALTVMADDARFDNVLGEIRTEGAVALESPVGRFDGRGMSLLIDPKGGRLERLIVDRCTKPIVVRRGLLERARTRPAPAPAPAATPPAAAPAGSSTPPGPTADAPVFYRLTLEDDVRVTRQRRGLRSVLTGRSLVAIFAMDGNALAEPNGIAAREPHPTFATASSRPSVALLAAVFAADPASLPTALLQPDPSDAEETVTIEYSGQLVIEPALASERLASPDDVQVTVLSGDAVPVTLNDEETKAEVRCDRVLFRSANEVVEAFGTASFPLTVESPRLRARGERFLLERGAGKGGFVGPGSIELASGGEAFAALAFDPARALVTRRADGTLLITALAGAPGPAAAVTIAWRDGLDLAFRRTGGGGDDEDNGALQSALFRGEVRAEGEEFTVDADRIEARFTDDLALAKRGVLERIVAEGSAGPPSSPAVAARRDGGGSLRAAQFDLALRRDPTGAVRPATLVARGPVEARDATQTLWAGALDVRFLADRPDESARSSPPGQRVSADIETVQATDGVQAAIRGKVASDPSVRVWADRIAGDGVGQRLTVEGNDVWIARETLLADRLRAIRLAEATRSAESDGPGRVRVFAAPLVDPAAEGPVERPTVSESTRLVAEWAERFRFEESGDGGRGAVELTGEVRVRSTPSRRSTDAIDAGFLRLELAERSGNAAPVEAIERVVARGAAAVESRAWSSDARDGDPRIFRLTGDTLAYDLGSREGSVEGPGSLLAHVPERTSDADPASAARAAQPAAQPATPDTGGGTGVIRTARIALGAEGTTRFRWNERLTMTRSSAGNDRFEVSMRGGVEVLHAGTGPEDRLTLLAERLDVVMDRPRGGAEAGAGIELGGTARILSIEGNGGAEGSGSRVLAQSGELDLTCDSFRYSVEAQMATLTAAPGSRVRILSRGAAAPIEADRVEWDLATGTITVQGATGTIGR